MGQDTLDTVLEVAPNSDKDNDHTQLKLVAIHLGASNSARTSEKQLELAKKICENVMNSSRSRGTSESKDGTCQRGTKKHKMSAVEAAVRLVELLENESSLNCGYGSNLNMEGRVECDASVMSGHDANWVGVGGVSCCKNPVKLAECLMNTGKATRPLGLVQPNLLAASGARLWMQQNCRHLLTAESRLISSGALSRYQVYKSNYDKALAQDATTSGNPSSSVCPETSSPVDERLDTVGAIAVDCDNNIACAMSSGGVVLKNRGRLGQACIPGAGCWAQESVATTTTGVGEYLTTTLFARAFHEKLKLNKLLRDLGQTSSSTARGGEGSMDFMISQAMSGCFDELLDSPALRHVPAHERFAGMLTVVLPSACSADNNHNEGNQQRHHEGSSSSSSDDGGGGRASNSASDNEQDFYLSYGHTTRSLCIGYMVCSAQEAQSFVSRLQDEDRGETRESSGDGDGASSSPKFLTRTLKLGPSR